MKNLARAGVILTLILMLLIVAIGCKSSVALATPEETVTSYLDATEDLDVGRMMDCVGVNVSAEERRQAEEAFKMMKDMGMSISITNRSINVVSQTEDSATVFVSAETRATFGGETETESMNETFTLVKRDGKWLLEMLPD
ncbi:hypothetical protein ACFLXE_05945 [Chloroflexota bacterium]